VRIAVVTEDYFPSWGAVAEQVHGFAREARRLGHVVKIITGDVRGASTDADRAEDVIRVGVSRTMLRHGAVARVTAAGGGALREALDRERFDVLHVHAPLTPVLPLLAVHHATVPVVGAFHAHARPALLFRVARRAQQRYLDRLDAAVAVSRACLSAFEGRLRADFRIVPNGVDAERFGRGRRLARFDDGKLNVLWVGRLEPRNGLDRMLAAFVGLRRTMDARLLVVGDGPLLPRYRASVPRELERDVVFAGKLLDERPDWYASADVYCAPTSIASFGITLLEAMAAGKPILASDIDGFREVMQHGREGELLPVDDAAAWTRALERLAREPLRAQAYAEHGRATAQRYDWSKVAAEVLGLYRAIGVEG
jgi:phosphatidylinositol alpha-mannosyltransferase